MESTQAVWYVIISSAVVIISYLFNELSKKKNISSVIMLILFGFIMGQVARVYDLPYEKLLPGIQILGIVGVVMIVLEAALELTIYRRKLSMILRAFVVAVVLLILCSLSIGLIFYYVLDMTMAKSLLYSVPLSIMSAAIIIPSITNCTEETREFMTYEATFSEILGIMYFYLVLDNYDTASVAYISVNVAQNVTITLISAFALSYALVFLLQYIRNHGKLFFIVAILTLLYGLGKLFHLSSLIIILFFGLLLNNHHLFIRGKLKEFVDTDVIDKLMKEFKTLTVETSFVLRTFFFILFGMSITLDALNDPWIYLVTFLILVILYGIRYINLKVIVRGSTNPLLYIAPRGLITVLLFYMIPEEMQSPNFNPGILLLTIIVTSLIMMVTLMRMKKPNASGAGEEGNVESDGAVAEGPKNAE